MTRYRGVWRNSTIVTSIPRCLREAATSHPMNPAPTTKTFDAAGRPSPVLGATTRGEFTPVSRNAGVVFTLPTSRTARP